MIKTPLSTVIGGAFWTPGCTVIGGNTPTFETVMRKLFANNEQGFFYDPNDLSTMFQDAAGTVPVTAVGQPVGLMLDKSKGPTLGSELNTTASPKMTGNAPVATYDSTTKVGTVNRVDVANQSFVTLTGATGGGWYKVSIKNTGSTQIALRNATAFAVDVTLVSIAANSNFTGYVYVASNFVLGIAAALGAGTFIIDTVREIAGNHAYQSVSASRPILQRNATTGAYYLAFDGADDFLQTNNIDFTATDKVSLFTGIRKLSTSSGIVFELNDNSASKNGAFYLASPAGASFPNQVTFLSKGSVYAAVSNNNLPPPRNIVISAKGDISNDTAMIRTNGLQLSDGANQGTGNYGNHPLYIGRRAGASLPFTGHIYGLIGIGKLVSDSETAAIENELAKRVGVTLNV